MNTKTRVGIIVYRCVDPFNIEFGAVHVLSLLIWCKPNQTFLGPTARRTSAAVSRHIVNLSL